MKVCLKVCLSLCLLGLFHLVQAGPGEPKIMEKYVEVQASVEQVWNSWTTSEGLASFFAKDHKLELKPGGAFEMYFLPEDSPERGSEGCKVLSYLPYEMFSFSWNAPPNLPEVRPLHTTVVLRFEALGKDRTAMRFSQHGWGEGEQWDKAYAYLDKSWDYVLNNLVKRFAEGGQTQASAKLVSDDTTMALVNRLHGTWVIDGKWNDGNKLYSIVTFEKGISPQVVKGYTYIPGENKERNLIYETIYTHNPYTGKVSFVSYASWSQFYEGTVESRGNTLIFNWKAFGGEKVQDYRQTVEVLDDNRYIWEVFQKKEGGYEPMIKTTVHREDAT